MSEPTVAQTIEWGSTGRGRSGEATSGDLAVITRLGDGALVAALDGLGHGCNAARAARAAAEVVRQCEDDDLISLVGRCHEALRKTRGAAMSLASISASNRKLSWLGIGNVEGRLLGGDPAVVRQKGSLSLMPGVLGHELPRIRTAELDVAPGDLLLFATDGVEPDFADSLDVFGSPQAITERIVAKHGKVTDDALSVAVRYLGAEP